MSILYDKLENENTWLNDLKIAEIATKYQDEIYNQVFRYHPMIKRIKGSDENPIDTDFHIDVILRGKGTGMLTVQEKALRHEHSHFNTFTMEYYNNADITPKAEGEYFNLGAQYYLSGYLNEDNTGFEKWIILNVAEFMSTVVLHRREMPSTSHATFLAWNYDDIPDKCIHASFNIGREDWIMV